MTKQNSELDSFLAALREQAGELLTDAGIYSVLDFGWEGENTPADDYVGLAMWSTDAPFEPDWFPWDRTSPPPMPTKREETFYKAGQDFVGTMELARNAIGFALYSFDHRKPDDILDDDEFFWEYSAGATIWLNIASDRIREYYVMARFEITHTEYDKQSRRSGFLRPFRALDPNETPSAKEAAGNLLNDAKELDSRRNSRNKIVHEVASRRGRNALLSLKHQRDASSQPPSVERSTADIRQDTKKWKEVTEAIHSDRTKEMGDTIAELKSWYLLVAHACALAFEYEYWKRIGK